MKREISRSLYGVYTSGIRGHQDRDNVSLTTGQAILEESLDQVESADPGRQSRSLPKLGKEYKKVVRECVNSRTSAIDLMRKLDFVEVLQELLLDPHDQALLPLLILKFKKKQMERAQKQTRRQSRTDQSININQISQLERSFEVTRRPPSPETAVNKPSRIGIKKRQQDKNQPDPSNQQASINLLKTKSKTTFKQALKEFMRENLSEFFESSTNTSKSYQGGVKTPKKGKKQENSLKNQQPKILTKTAKKSPKGEEDVWQISEQGSCCILSTNRNLLRDSEAGKQGNDNKVDVKILATNFTPESHRRVRLSTSPVKRMLKIKRKNTKRPNSKHRRASRKPVLISGLAAKMVFKATEREVRMETSLDDIVSSCSD